MRENQFGIKYIQLFNKAEIMKYYINFGKNKNNGITH